MNNVYRPRRKAWLGAAIGAAVGIGSAIFGASSSKKAQQEQYRLQRQAEARKAGLQSAMNLTQAYANAGELEEEFQNRFLRYGGRRKAAWGADDTTALIGSLGSAGQTIATSMVGQAKPQGFDVQALKPVTSRPVSPADEAVYDSINRKNVFAQPQVLYQLGGRRRSRT